MQFQPVKKTLLKRLADGRFHSGEALARELGLTRSAVWTMVRELAALGLEIRSLRGRGYRMPQPLELLDAAVIRARLSARAAALLESLEVHDQLDSTNGELQRAGTAARGVRVCLAECQTAGRGRLGRSWQSPFAGNLSLSLSWRMHDPAALAGLSLAVGVAAVRVLRAIGAEQVGLKWPNDLLWQGRKLGGILLEAAGEANGSFAVIIGIGLNGHLPQSWSDRIEQPCTDLRQVLGGIPLARNGLTAHLLGELLELLDDYPQRGLTDYLDEWRRYHCQLGRSALLQQGDRQIAGVIAGIDEQGQLLLDTAEGLRAFASGDVRLRLDGG